MLSQSRALTRTKHRLITVGVNSVLVISSALSHSMFINFHIVWYAVNKFVSLPFSRPFSQKGISTDSLRLFRKNQIMGSNISYKEVFFFLLNIPSASLRWWHGKHLVLFPKHQSGSELTHLVTVSEGVPILFLEQGRWPSKAASWFYVLSSPTNLDTGVTVLEQCRTRTWHACMRGNQKPGTVERTKPWQR